MNENVTRQSLTFAEQSFLLADEHRKALEQNFTPDILEEYNSTKEKIYGSVIDMIKNGKSFKEQGTDIVIVINSKEYHVPYKEFKNSISNDDYTEFILPYELKEEKRKREEREERLRQEEQRLREKREKLRMEEQKFYEAKGDLGIPSDDKPEVKEDKPEQKSEPVNPVVQNKDIAEIKTNLSKISEQLSKNLNNKSNDNPGKVAELERRISDLNRQLSDKINLHKQEISKYEKEIADLKKSADNSTNIYDANRISELSEKVDSLNKEKNNLKTSLASKEKELNSLKKELEAKDDSFVQEEINELKAENKTLSTTNSTLKKNFEYASKEKESLLNKIEELKTQKGSFQEVNEKVEMLENLAYNDLKTSAFTLNAFNRDFPEVELGKMILVLVNIQQMKTINEVYGKEAGDTVIDTVVEGLQKSFPSGKIYRVMGVEFAVIVYNSTLNHVKGQMSDLLNDLMKNDISIVYGISVGNKAKSHEGLVQYAEEEKKRMQEDADNIKYDKIREDLNNSPYDVSNDIEDTDEDELEDVTILDDDESEDEIVAAILNS